MVYLVLFGWTFLSASLVPIASEPYYTWLVYEEQTLVWPLLVATLGNTLGGTTTFLLGRWGGKVSGVEDRQSRISIRAKQWITVYGPFALLLSWVPILGDILVGLGGALQLPFRASMLWMTIGKAVRYTVLGWLVLLH